jgi:hypothetical protein
MLRCKTKRTLWICSSLLKILGIRKSLSQISNSRSISHAVPTAARSSSVLFLAQVAPTPVPAPRTVFPCCSWCPYNRILAPFVSQFSLDSWNVSCPVPCLPLHLRLFPFRLLAPSCIEPNDSRYGSRTNRNAESGSLYTE